MADEPTTPAASTSSATTRGIQVDVHCRYVAEQSSPSDGQWFFAYQITISNLSERTVQLISREWIITNAVGKQETVRGPGVVGHQPVLRPNEGFQYVSGCPLDTAFGTMQGTYHMMAEDGEAFDVAITTFTLAEPMAVN
jgi:ApaG protein